MKILVDENLTPDLTQLGNARGYYTTSVVHLGLVGLKDFQLIPYCIEHDYVLMSIDDGDPKDLAETAGLHPGLIFLDVQGYDHMFTLATAALDYLEEQAAAAGEEPGSFMVNRVIEVAGYGTCQHYNLPADNPVE